MFWILALVGVVWLIGMAYTARNMDVLAIKPNKVPMATLVMVIALVLWPLTLWLIRK